MIATAVVIVLLLGPLLLGLWGLFHAPRGGGPGPEPALPWNWKQTISSALLYTLAFNLTFFIQELFLVLPKALTPGVRATLFHNSHSWEGENPLTGLFQGTGALAIFLSGLVCALLLQRRPPRSSTLRLRIRSFRPPPLRRAWAARWARSRKARPRSANARVPRLSRSWW